MQLNWENSVLNNEEKKIVESVLFLLKKKSWANISLEEIKIKSKIKLFDKLVENKKDILKKINQYFDYKLHILSANLENSNNKDMIFEIIMMRFDILQNYRKEVISIFESFKNKPQELVILLPSLLDSMIKIIQYTKISSKGLAGQLKIKGILIIYISTFFIWMKDESSSLEKTMTSLDQYLDNAGKILKFIK